jgi:hypothetical protein
VTANSSDMTGGLVQVGGAKQGELIVCSRLFNPLPDEKKSEILYSYQRP